MLTDETMWQAVITNDPDYDGRFFYGVLSTGIFCRPSCKSKPPLRKNVLFFFIKEEALAQGLRPCKRCRPDLGTTGFEPAKEAVEAVVRIIHAEYHNPELVGEIFARSGFSPFYLQHAFKKHTGSTLGEYLRRVRVQEARILLSFQEMTHVEVGFAVGFKSISNFYAVFRDITGMTPGECLRRTNKNGVGDLGENRL